METQISEILENILGLLGLAGSFEVEEREGGVFVSIETQEPGMLIGHQGETLTALQLLINLIVIKKFAEPKRAIIDVADWRKGKEEELAHKARSWAQQVLSTGQSQELPPMPSWQRRIIHMTIQETPGVRSESVGEGADRYLVISLDEAKN